MSGTSLKSLQAHIVPKRRDAKHYGVLGMRWGFSRSRGAGGRVSGKPANNGGRSKGDEPLTPTTKSGKKAVKKGASSDAIVAAEIKAKARREGLDSLSNKELETLATRLKKEQSYKDWKAKNKTGSEKAQEFLLDVLKQQARKQVDDRVNDHDAVKIGRQLMKGIYQGRGQAGRRRDRERDLAALRRIQAQDDQRRQQTT